MISSIFFGKYKNVRKAKFILDKSTKSYYNTHCMSFRIGRVYVKNNLVAKKYNCLTNETVAVYHLMSQKMSLSDSASMILYMLCANDGEIELSFIPKYTGLSKQTVNSSIRNLEKSGNIILSPIDKKSKKVILTQKGKQVCNNTVMRILQAENDIFSSWDKSDRDLYFALTEKFINQLRKEAEKF